MVHFDSAAPVSDRLKAIIVDQFGVGEEEVTDIAKFVEELGADSLDVIEIVMAIEEEFNIEIPDNDFEDGQFATVGDLVTYVEGRLKGKAA